MSRPMLLLLCLVGPVCAPSATSASPEDPIKERAKVCLEVARQGLALVDRDLEGVGYFDPWKSAEKRAILQR